MDTEKISALIKTKRKEKELTQEELAQRIGVTAKAVSRWETGRGTPDISLLVPLSEELGVSVSELLKGKEDEKDDKNIMEIVDYIDKTKKKKNKYMIPLAAVIYVILLMFYLFYLKVEYNEKIPYNYEVIINLFFTAAIFFTNRMIADHYFDKLEDRVRMNKISYIMILVIYLIMFFNLTVFSRPFGIVSETYRHPYNLIPFKTIIEYFRYPVIETIIIHIVGNFVILMPVQFLIMKIFDIKKFSVGLLIDILLSTVIEFIQMATHSGIFDIDDIILNVAGMSVIFLIVTAFDKRKKV